ncbi:ribosome maturation factor RimM [Rhodocyclus gracilis]|nr:ribosome maturation factor RimM [Rhodocyclus gracilis]
MSLPPRESAEVALTAAAPGDSASGDMVVLGKVVDAYGIRGALRVHPFADDPAAWAKLPVWRIGREGEAPENWREVRVLRARLHSGVVVADLEGVVGRSAAEALHGALVGVPRAGLPPTADDEFYWADLIGLEVVNTRDEVLGRVLGLIETGANDVLRVGQPGVTNLAAEKLLPFVAAVVLEVDVPAGRVRVDWEADW